MSFLKFEDGAAMFDATPIENVFILEHIPSLPDVCIRVYMYSRMLALHPELGDRHMLMDALKLDGEGLTGAFRALETAGLVKRVADNPPEYQILPLRAMGAADPMERDYYEFRDFNLSAQKLCGNNLLHGEISVAQDWITIFNFTQDAALRLLEHGVSKVKDKNNFSPRHLIKKLDATAKKWAERGVRTLEDVNRAIKQDDGVYQIADAVLKRYGLRRRPTDDELILAEKWKDEWNLTLEDIISACGETTAASNPSFKYLDSVLKSRLTHGDGIAFAGVKQVLNELGSRGAPTAGMKEKYLAYLAEGFEPETIVLAAKRTNARNRHSFEDIDWMLERWRELELFRCDMAQAYIDKASKKAAEVGALLSLAGSEKKPSEADITLYERMTSASTPALIEFAAECAKGKEKPFAYMDKLISSWAKSGINSVDAARAEYEKRTPYAKVKPQNPALNYAQREYTEQDFGEDFYFDVSKFIGGDNK